jgi:hypothetical protein
MTRRIQFVLFNKLCLSEGSRARNFTLKTNGFELKAKRALYYNTTWNLHKKSQKSFKEPFGTWRDIRSTKFWQHFGPWRDANWLSFWHLSRQGKTQKILKIWPAFWHLPRHKDSNDSQNMYIVLALGETARFQRFSKFWQHFRELP